jgi:hypothetical protein
MGWMSLASIQEIYSTKGKGELANRNLPYVYVDPFSSGGLSLRLENDSFLSLKKCLPLYFLSFHDL